MKLAVRTTLAAPFLALALVASATDDAGWMLDEKAAPLAGAADVQHTRWSLARPPGARYDVIGLHRYRTAGAPTTAALLYLPGTNMNGVAALHDDDHNLWLFLAHRGVDVYTLDYRTHAVPASGVGQFGFMRGWTMAAFVSDIQAAAQKARAESGRERLFVAGFSRGVSLAYAFAATEPDAVAGLIALDGSFKSHSPKNLFDPAADLQKLESNGWANDVSGRAGWEARDTLMQAAARNPAAPASDPKFKSIGEQLAYVLYSAWRPGGLANAVDGLSKPQILAKLLAGYDRYYPAVQDSDGRSISDRDDDPRTPIDDRWGELETPILYFGCTGMGGDWLLNGIYSADKSGSPDVTLNVLERYGHLDVIVGERARSDVFEPTAAWISKRAKP